MEAGDDVELGELLRDHVVAVLREHGFDQGVHLDSKRGTQKGDHYMSSIHKIKASEKTSDGGERNFFLLAKCIPTNQDWKTTFDLDTHFRKEVAFYGEVLPSLLDFRKRHEISGSEGPTEEGPTLFPKCYAAVSNGTDDFILMEDLSEEGYVMADKKDGLSLERSLMVVRSMAAFHAQSYAVAEKEPALLERFKGVAVEAFFTGANAFKYARSFGQQVRSATEGVRKWCPESAERLDEFLGTDVYKRMVDLADERDVISVINLGDCWTNNLFFRETPDGVPEEMRFIDFQLLRFASPVLDLSYFLFTSTEQSVREKFLVTLIKEYHESLTRSMARLSCDAAVSFQDLESQMKKYAVFGLYMALILVPLYHVDSKEALDVETSNDDALSAMVRFHLKVMQEEMVQLKVTSLVKQCIQFGYI